MVKTLIHYIKKDIRKIIYC